MIKITGNDYRNFIFKANTKEDCLAWLEELERHIDSSEGVKFNKSALGIKKPWRFDTISEKQLITEADTGDILLFKGNSVNSKFIRKFTSSTFDHVAMILKFEADPNEIYIVESTGNRGVALNKWSYLRPYIGEKEFYNKVIFRHLEFDRSNQLVDNLEQFLKEAIGQKYGLGGGKLWRRKTVNLSEKNNRLMIDEERTFFCSELVAKAFKVLGILENDSTSCSKFMPGHFASKGEGMLQLTEGTSIQEELHIIIDAQP